ncbi:hypothetical protein FQR65_LT09145 [Abscondita terminalis]|nr:hypothetical protein FQR65_LT09145 [Abscondita terminalis]
MKVPFALIIIAIFIFAFAGSTPVRNDRGGEVVRANRQKRLTCDLFSFQSSFLTVNHSACAAHCLLLFEGYKGGYCQNGVCHCRK